jgi:methanogenic corrinoid protein MtbC1
VGDPYKPSRDAILEAVEKFDPTSLEFAVQHALALGSASTIYDRVIRPIMVEIGNRWHEGALTIGQEHLATQVMENAARRLLGLVQPSGSARQVVLAGFAGDEHTLPLYGVALHMAGAGFRVVMLGGRTPASAIRHAVVELAPSCVGLSVTVPPPPHDARALVDAYADACGDTPWMVGGTGAEALRGFVESRGGAVAPRDDPRLLLRTLESLIAKGRRRPQAAAKEN